MTPSVCRVTVHIGSEADALLRGSPEVRDRLQRVGAPSTFTPGPRMYTAPPEFTVVRDEQGKPLVRFGSSEPLAVAMCIDPTTGAVWEVMNRPVPRRLFVSSSLSQFADTVDAVAARFPFYDDPDDDRAAEQAAKDLAALIGAIDAEAVVPDRFWSTFLDDVRIGDFPPR
jgi:hypothetical protein